MPYQGTSFKRELCPTGHLSNEHLYGHIPRMVPNNLAALRKVKGVSQDVLAVAAGTTRNYYGKLERGERALTMEYLERLAKALDVEPYAVIAPEYLFPSEEQLADMLRLAQQQLPMDLPYSEWPRAVAASLRTRLQRLGGERSNGSSGDG
jgi:transcriptional regulator with XRE-family HTH domain